MKVCTHCKRELLLKDFYRRYKAEGFHSWCKKCTNANDPESKLRRNKEAFKVTFEWYKSTKNNKPCMDCKVTFPYYVLEYDHRDPSLKEGHVNSLLPRGRKRVEAEMAKCDLVCKNCHAVRTQARRK